MANQSNQQRVRRMASPSLKTGPMRATFPFVLRQGSSPTSVSRSTSGRKNSPSNSPTPICWSQVPTDTLRKNPRSPEHRSSPDRPGSPFIIIKEKSRPRHSPIPVIKRTSSLDTITTPYLKGEWPRETVVPYHTLCVPDADVVSLTGEKSTQTPEEWDDHLERKMSKSHMRSTSLGNGDTLIIKKEAIKARLAKSKEVARSSSSSVQRTSPVQGNHAAIAAMSTVFTTIISPTALHHSKAMNIPVPHIPSKQAIHIRGSVEGLSQEIETLVLQNSGERQPEEFISRVQEATPDGHRAPIAELLCTTRTIDTQTPAVEDIPSSQIIHDELEEEGRFSSSSHSNSSESPTDSRSQSESPPSLPIIPGTLDTSRPSSLCDNNYSHNKDKDCDSPKLKSIFIREPPDGCERIKIVQEETGPELSSVKRGSTPSLKESLFCPIKNPSERYCIPSEVSAFCPLLKPYVRQASEMALRTSPSSQTIEGQ